MINILGIIFFISELGMMIIFFITMHSIRKKLQILQKRELNINRNLTQPLLIKEELLFEEKNWLSNAINRMKNGFNMVHKKERG